MDLTALDKHLPGPFAKEWRGGPGQVIHDKLVVCDFHGDNLLAVHDSEFEMAIAVEAIRCCVL